MQLIDVLGLLNVQLEDVEDSSVDVQHSCGDASRCKHFAHDTISILKLDGSQELSLKGRGELSGWDESIFGPDAAVLKELRLNKLTKEWDSFNQLIAIHRKIMYYKIS